MSELFLIRHGQASFGEENYDKLSAHGVQQSIALGAQMRGQVQPTKLVAGSLVRHQQTLAGWQEGFNAGKALLPEEDAGFNEFDHNEVLNVAFPEFAERSQLAAHVMKYENPRKAFHELYVKSVNRWISGQYDAEYRESFPEFFDRCCTALNRLLTTAERSESILVFTSGGPIGACLQKVLGLSTEKAFRLNEMLANSGVTKLVFNQHGECNLSYFNNFSHLTNSNIGVTYR